MKNKVGIVMLSYNRADVVVNCLNSLAMAKNEQTDFELFLLDNCSTQNEYSLIQNAFNNFVSDIGIKAKLTRLSYNSGYPAGNNIGIKYFLEDKSITHICLLNSDVIVTDYWLDRLLEVQKGAIGPVTNACGNEQTISIPFNVKVNEKSYEKINAFAQQRYLLFNKWIVNTNFLGFFCFVGTRKLFQEVGYLDESFGRGAYEDDDFCVRMLQKGYTLNILRGVFIYHFGSASFSQIPLKNLFNHLDKNRLIFEKKHKVKWQNRDMLPFLGFKQDMQFLFENNVPIPAIQELFSNYSSNLEVLLNNMFNERRTSQLSSTSLLKMKRLVAKLLG